MTEPVKLESYQVEGVEFLASHPRALLADAMGLGKTGQAVAASEIVFGPGPANILVICPANVRNGWKREFPRFRRGQLGLRVVETAAGFAPLLGGVTVISYDLLDNPKVGARLKSIMWELVICDEIHNLKNKDSKRTLFVYGQYCKGGPGSLIHNAEYFWGLTGTPMPNAPPELFPMLRAFGVWKANYWSFVNAFCVMRESDYGSQVIKAKNIPALKNLLGRCMLRRGKNVIGLPELTYEDVPLDPNGLTHPIDMAEWKKEETGANGVFLRKFLDRYEGIEDESFSAEGTKLDRSISTLRMVTGVAKIKPLANYLRRELDSYGAGKMLIFAQHRDCIEGLRHELRSYGAVIIYGGTNQTSKDTRIKKFLQSPDCRLMIGQIKAAGVGIDGFQHVCRQVVFAESSWVPDDNAQAIARVYRMGQKNPVHVRFAYLANSLDERVQIALARKTKMITDIFN